MRSMFKGTRPRWGRLGKKLVCCVSAAGLSAAFLPAAAFATDTTSAWYDLPGADQAITFQHTATGNGHEYTYKYVTIGNSSTGRVAPMMTTYYEVLGLNYINAYTGTSSIYTGAATQTGDWDTSSATYNTSYTKGSKGSLQTRNAALAITGTANNENPDEYVWNYCVWANGGAVSADSRALDHGNTSTGSVSVNIAGTEYSDFPREVYTECDIIGTSASSDTYGTSTYADWVKLENQRSNRPNSGTYDPYFASYSVTSGGGATMVSGLHKLADTVDSVIAQSKDANGNYTLQSRYGGNTANGTGAVIDKYQDLVQGTQYYALSKIADKTVSKATTAVLVGYDPETGNYACRKFNTDKDPDGNQYGGRVANYLSSISTSITDKGLKAAQEPYSSTEGSYIVWYTPEQIVANCDAAFVCDCYSSNSISAYLATASDGKPHTVYTPKDVTHSEENNTADLTRANNKAKAAGKHTTNFCFSYPSNMFGNFYAQGVENGMLAMITCAYTYPSLFNLTDLYAYWAKNVWHIKDSALQSVVDATTSSSDLSSQVGTIGSDYATNAERIFKQGNQYYLSHTSAIDAMNSGNLKTYSVSGLKTHTASLPDPKAPAKTTGIAVGKSATAGSGAAKAAYKVTSNKSATVTYAASKAKKSAKSLTVPATVKIGGKTYKVTAVAKGAFKGKKATRVTLGKNVRAVKAGAFKGSRVKTVVAKTSKLTKKSVKGSLKGSKVATVKVAVGKAKANKKCVKAYKKAFTKKNCGKKVAVKR